VIFVAGQQPFLSTLICLQLLDVNTTQTTYYKTVWRSFSPLLLTSSCLLSHKKRFKSKKFIFIPWNGIFVYRHLKHFPGFPCTVFTSEFRLKVKTIFW